MVKNKFSLSDKKILLLGGNGLIGSAIRNLFYKNGGKIVVIDKKKLKCVTKLKPNKKEIEETQNEIIFNYAYYLLVLLNFLIYYYHYS